MEKFFIGIVVIAIIFLGFLKYTHKKTVQGPKGSEVKKERSAGEHEFTLEHGGMSRRYIVYLPQSYTGAEAMPVIVNLHGGGGNANGVNAMSLMNATADDHGFIVVYPEGAGVRILGKTIAAWNTGTDERIAHVDDIGFIAAVIEKVKTDFSVDSTRIYATGMSNGAQMAYALACELSDTIAAIAPIGAQGVFTSCTAKRPVPIIHFHGTEDPCAPYDGGTCGGCIQKYFKNVLGIEMQQTQFQCEAVPEHIKKWVARNRIKDLSSRVVHENGSARCIAYGKDEPGEVVLCSIAGAGHTWPGGAYGTPCEDGMDKMKCKEWISVVGGLSHDVSANELMWEFFQRHRLVK